MAGTKNVALFISSKQISPPPVACDVPIDIYSMDRRSRFLTYGKPAAMLCMVESEFRCS